MESKEIVRDLISNYIKAKPRRITLKLNWNDKRSLINLKGDNLDETAEYSHECMKDVLMREGHLGSSLNIVGVVG